MMKGHMSFCIISSLILPIKMMQPTCPTSRSPCMTQVINFVVNKCKPIKL